MFHPAATQCSVEPSDLGDWTGRKAGDQLVSDPATLVGAAVVDGAELLVALPGQVNFTVGVAGIQTPDEFGLLGFGEVLDIVAEEATDLVERVVLVASVAESVLLDATADLVDDLGGQPTNSLPAAQSQSPIYLDQTPRSYSHQTRTQKDSANAP